MQVHTDPSQVPWSSAPGIIIHVLRENKRPIGFAPWPTEKKKRKRKKGEEVMGRWESDRWVPAGTNEAGDPMYERDVKAGDKTEPKPKKKTAAKKKA